MKKNILIIIGLLFTSVLSGLSLISTETLLSDYLKRDIELNKASLNFQKKIIENQIEEYQNGFSINIATGTIRFDNLASDKQKISFSPTINAKFPEAANLTLGVKGDFAFEAADFLAEDISFSASLDLISSSSTERQIRKAEAERSLLQAQRSLREKALETEKKFYTELIALINKIDSIIKKQNDLYDQKIELEKIKLEGYSQNSVTYRRIDIALSSLLHEIESEEHSLIYDYKVFYKKCGQDLTIEKNTELSSLIPTDITRVSLKNIEDFDRKKFKELDNAHWNKKINELKRKAQMNYYLDASGGYTINNKNTSSDSLDIGLKGAYSGIEIGLGTNFPISKGKSPSFTISASFDPLSFKTEKLEEKIELISEKEEEMDLSNARISFGSTLVEKKTAAENLEWEEDSILQNLQICISQEENLYNWYKEGVITESEYLSAKNNVQSYFVKLLDNYLSRIIYNNEVSQLFYE